jgi:hypothetical protein
MLPSTCFNWLGFLAEVLKLMRMLFPVLSIEGLNGNVLWHGVQTSNINIIAVWIRPGNVKGFDATCATEIMLCDASIKRVSREGTLPFNKPKCRFRNDKVEVGI